MIIFEKNFFSGSGLGSGDWDLGPRFDFLNFWALKNFGDHIMLTVQF